MAKIRKVYGGNALENPLRVTLRARRRKKGARLLVRCGCCEERLEIYLAENPEGNPMQESLEINGVHASIAQWQEILLPVLGMESPRKAKVGKKKKK